MMQTLRFSSVSVNIIAYFRLSVKSLSSPPMSNAVLFESQICAIRSYGDLGDKRSLNPKLVRLEVARYEWKLDNKTSGRPKRYSQVWKALPTIYGRDNAQTLIFLF